MNRAEGLTHMPWLTHPRDWHPAEASFVRACPGHYGPAGRGGWLASQILRRLPGLCPALRAYYYDLWLNRLQDHWAIQFEWASGAAQELILRRPLDLGLGPGTQITLLAGQTVPDCHAPGRGGVRLHSTRHPAGTIGLRRTTGHDDKTRIPASQYGERRRRLRQAIE